MSIFRKNSDKPDKDAETTRSTISDTDVDGERRRRLLGGYYGIGNGI
ncbi:hypothetical protein NONI108955_38500 [Nocardia ninae]|uniref:Uncharacterized protein n=1 Tax=Nocardia ninae NBRC 108245 TaxID=1210091 RepID=A0A511M6C8_9NOCA|nr:hypothetical protein [Nocardia ninae]GEM35688.1 hypothetical protein NN4_02070 [Nocardia ninae NBRC 108245]